MKLDKAIGEIEKSPRAIRFERLVAIATAFWGKPRVKGSHHIWATTWKDAPVLNLQASKASQAKPYQVAQVLAALCRLGVERPELLEADDDDDDDDDIEGKE